MRIIITFVITILLVSIMPSIAPHAQKPRAPITITVWLHKYDWGAGVASLAAEGDLVSTVSPAWYRADASGNILPIEGASVDDPKFLAMVRPHKITLRPLVMNTSGSKFDPDLIRGVLGDEKIGTQQTTAIALLVRDKGYDGIDLDYENISPDELPNLAHFVTMLAAALHKESKTLAVCIEWKYAGKYPEAWRAIAEAADSVELMAYSEHNPSTGPGPIASPSLIKERLKSVLNSVPADKLTLGMAIYAVSWSPKGATSGTWSSLVEPTIKKGTLVSRDPATSTPFLKDSGTMIYYEDATSIIAKMKIATALGVHDFAFWRLGGEDPAIWSAIISGSL